MDIQRAITDLKGLGLTQKQIGCEIGCSQEAISQMASGKICKVRPSYKIVDGLKRLAEKYGLAVAQPPERKAARTRKPNTK